MISLTPNHHLYHCHVTCKSNDFTAVEWTSCLPLFLPMGIFCTLPNKRSDLAMPVNDKLDSRLFSALMSPQILKLTFKDNLS